MSEKKMTLIDQDQIIALQLKNMSLEDAIFNVGYERGRQEQPRPAAGWIKATEFNKEKGGMLFYRFLGPHLKSIGVGHFSRGSFYGQPNEEFGEADWQYLWILDESDESPVQSNEAKCNNCGKPESKQAIVNHIGDKYCLDCMRLAQFCISCDKYIPDLVDDSYNYEDDRCPECVKRESVQSNEGEAVDMTAIFEELWDEHAEYIDDDIDSLSRWAGSSVVDKNDFMRVAARLYEQYQQSKNK